MTNDRELLELAAKAAGIEWVDGHESTGLRNANGTFWNPLTDSGQALELAVKLGMEIHIDRDNGFTSVPIYDEKDNHHVSLVVERHGEDPLAATRRAIVRVAAEIGRSMK